MASVPRTLTELIMGFIEELGGKYENVQKNLDTLMGKDRWIKDFQAYLQKRSLEEKEQILRFLLLTQIVLEYQKLIENDQNQNSAKQKERLKHDQRELFNYTMITFFSEESEDQIALSNQKLFEILSTYSENTDNSSVTKEMLDHLKKAQKDSLVWIHGLDPVYMNFLKQTSTSRSAMACLLSIL